MAPVTRRRALAGAAGAVLAGATSAAGSSPTAAMSPEAAALLHEFHEVASRFNAALRRLEAAAERTVCVPEPDALIARRSDLWALNFITPRGHWSGDFLSYGFDEQIARLRALPDSEREPGRAIRRNEIVGAWDRWHADRAAAREASGEDAAAADYRIAGDEHDAFLFRLARLRTTDPDVMRIKAAAVLNLWSGQADRFDGAVERVLEGDGDLEDPLCYSLMRDVLRGLGAEFRVMA